MYSRDQVKTIVEKIINMAKADAVEVTLTGGERSGTRWANSSITVNLVQYDRNVNVTVRVGQKVGNASTRDFSDPGLKAMVDEAVAEANQAQDTPNLPELLGAQEYIPVDAALPPMVNFGPAERAKMVRTSIDISEKLGTVGAGYIPKNDQTTCNANSKGLFAYYRAAESGLVLTCRMADGTGSGWAGITGVKDPGLIDATVITETASNKALRSRKAKALEPGRYTVILEPRANARFLSLMTGIFGGGGGGRGGGGGGGRGGGGGAAGGRGGGPPVPDEQAAAAPAGGGRGGGGGGFLAGKNPGDKVFSDLFTLKSDIGNQVLRQTPILPDFRPAKPVTWVEKGVLGAAGLVGKPVPMHMGESYDGGGSALIPPVRIEDFYMTSVSPAVAP
jgi:hypothetical protein